MAREPDAPITIYHIGNLPDADGKKSGPYWWDLCAGPHVEHTGLLPKDAIALESIAGATRLRFLVHLGPGPSGITMVIDSMPEKEGRILHRRLGEHHANMQRVVDGIKAAAESM